MSTRETPASFGRLTAGLGVASVLVSLGGIFLAAAFAPWFSPFRHALSFLGIAGFAVAPVFNGALLVGGALGAGFVVAVWTATGNPIHRAALVVLLLAMVFMALVGVFPLPAAMHGVVAAGFFVFMTFGIVVWGAGDFTAGRPARGGALLVASALHVVSWLWWALFGWPGPGVAVPELVGAVSLGVWALWLSADAWPRDVDHAAP